MWPQSGSTHRDDKTLDSRSITHFDGILNQPHNSSGTKRWAGEINGRYSLFEGEGGRQTAAVKRGNDHKREDYILVIPLKSASSIREKWGAGQVNELTSILKRGLWQRKGQLLQQPAMSRPLTVSNTVVYKLLKQLLVACAGCDFQNKMFCFVLFSNWLQLTFC